MGERTFTDSPAVRASVPLLVGLVGPSGSGKTKSALRLATGMQRVTGGDIFGLDSEANRMLHYAEEHRFRHVPFVAPFGPLDYLAGVQHCVRQGARIAIIDSASHMHEGPGGTLETHDAELQRLAGDDYQRRAKMTMLAWQRPKAELRRLLNTLLQLQVNLIFCFRAKEKIKMVKGKDPQPLGFQPIAGDEMFYEMVVSCLLYPGSGGVPTWQSEELGERVVMKLPAQFRGMFKPGQPLDEDTGEALAKWAAGGMPPKAHASTRAAEVVARLVALGAAEARVLGAVNRISIEDLTGADVEALITLGIAIKNGRKTVEEAFPAAREPGEDG